jgi:phosphosulfolactate synthase
LIPERSNAVNQQYGYDFLDIKRRPGKPRQTGLTLCRDHMRGLAEQQDFLQTYGEFVDYVKINTLNPCLYPVSLLKEKLKLYTRHKVVPFPGGMLYEAAHAQGKVDAFFDHIRALRYRAVEISENVLALPEAEKLRAVKKAKQLGMEVFFEWGNKYPDKPLQLDTAVSEIQRLLQEGVDRIILERSEINILVGPGFDRETVSLFVELVNRVGIKYMILEVGNIRHMLWLIEKFGPEVNIGPRVDWEEVKTLEPARVGIGRYTGYPIFNQWIGDDKLRSDPDVKLQYKLKEAR